MFGDVADLGEVELLLVEVEQVEERLALAEAGDDGQLRRAHAGAHEQHQVLVTRLPECGHLAGRRSVRNTADERRVRLVVPRSMTESRAVKPRFIGDDKENNKLTAAAGLKTSSDDAISQLATKRRNVIN